MTDTYTHILLIEDDPAVARALQDGLERDGFRVTWKASGAEGIEFLLKPSQPSLILTVPGIGYRLVR